MRCVAYVDESQRDRRYLVAASIIETARVADVRRALRSVRPRQGPARRHFVKESDRERHALLAAVRALPARHVVVDLRGDDGIVAKRAASLAELSWRLVAAGVGSVVLDNVDDAQRRRDRRTLAACLGGRDVEYRHEVPHSTEPMLWVPDAVAWCAGAGRAWRAALDGWVEIIAVPERPAR